MSKADGGDSTRLVVCGVNASKTKYHRPDLDDPDIPACRTTPRTGRIEPWPAGKAAVWRSPCKNKECYPDGDDAVEEVGGDE